MTRKVISHKLWVTSFLFLLFFTYHLSPITYHYCYAEPISSSELFQNPQWYDEKEIVYEGEVVGEVMQRKEGAWVNVYDGENSIGVWMSKELAQTIEHQGSYKEKGDILQIQGVFNYTCQQHGGDLDIHAISLRKLKSGWVKQEKIIVAKRNLLVVLSIMLCLILILRILIIR